MSGRPSVATILLGANKLEQITQTLRAADLVLTSDDLAALDAVTQPQARYPQSFLQRVYEDPAYKALGLDLPGSGPV